MKLEQEGFEHIGNVGVDAGLCWIGDPCYIIHQDNSKEPSLRATKVWESP